jgi:hypothetical protein
MTETAFTAAATTTPDPAAAREIAAMRAERAAAAAAVAALTPERDALAQTYKTAREKFEDAQAKAGSLNPIGRAEARRNEATARSALQLAAVQLEKVDAQLKSAESAAARLETALAALDDSASLETVLRARVDAARAIAHDAANYEAHCQVVENGMLAQREQTERGVDHPMARAWSAVTGSRTAAQEQELRAARGEAYDAQVSRAVAQEARERADRQVGEYSTRLVSLGTVAPADTAPVSRTIDPRGVSNDKGMDITG